MPFRPPNRLLQSAVLVALIAAAVTLWAVLSAPWLGLTAVMDGGSVRIEAVSPSGPAQALPVPSTLVAIGPVFGESVTLEATDVVEEPDFLGSYAEIERFMARQTRLARVLAAGEVEVVVRDTTMRLSTHRLVAGSRPLLDLPSSFWVQWLTGIGSLLIGAWVLALRPRETATWLYALSGAMIMASSLAAAVYSTREIAIDGTVFRVLSAINHGGAIGFGAAPVVLFLRWPRPLVSAAVAWLVPVVATVWFWFDVTRLAGDPAVGSQLACALEMLLIVALVPVQWFANRGDPRARAAVAWVGLTVMVGAGAFISLIVAPVLLETMPAIRQGHAFGFFLLIYAGLALGVGRFRLFEVEEWAFRIVFYSLGVSALVAIDAGLVLILHLRQDLSLGLALLVVGFGYLPLRGALWERLVVRRPLPAHELFAAVVDVSFAANSAERAGRWRRLLERLFEPLSVEETSEPRESAAVLDDGLVLRLPAVADAPALVLSCPGHGHRLFGTRDLKLARQLVRLVRHAEASRSSFERGRTAERMRIARDLHDDVGARLLSGLHRTEVEDVHRALREALADIRTIVGGLTADHLPATQVLAALRHETGERLEAAGIDMIWHDGGEAAFASLLLDYPVYRGLTSVHRELVSNVIRHARASRVDVVVDRVGERLTMSIADDGVGLAEPCAGNGGHGLAGMRRRIGELGGRFEVVPVEQGTRVDVELPSRLGEVAQGTWSAVAGR